MFRRSRFDELVRTQLDLFASDESVLIEEAVAADSAWTNASAEESEDLYGDYQLVVDAVGERLHDVREAYAASLDEKTGREYRASFDRGARKRFGPLASFLEDD